MRPRLDGRDNPPPQDRGTQCQFTPETAVGDLATAADGPPFGATAATPADPSWPAAPPTPPGPEIGPDVRPATQPTPAGLADDASGSMPAITGPGIGESSASIPAAGTGSGDDALVIQGEVRPGMLLFDTYEVEQKLGEGGMGSVWLVRHVDLDTRRALKLIVAGYANDPQIRHRFRREARAMAKLDHPGAVRVHQARIDGHAAFIEMEYVRGVSLDKLIRPGEPMPVDWVGRIAAQLCDVLAAAHEVNIVHRDLKPSNMMLVEGHPPGRERLKVLDFGIAKILDEGGEGVTMATAAGVPIGTAVYCSPEQSGGERAVDARSDLYTVGVILYEMLTGARPFSGHWLKVFQDHMHTPPPRFAEKAPPGHSWPAGVEDVVFRCLAKDPDDRFDTARDLADALLRAIEPLGFEPTSPAPRPGDYEVASEMTPPPPSRPASPPASRIGPNPGPPRPPRPEIAARIQTEEMSVFDPTPSRADRTEATLLPSNGHRPHEWQPQSRPAHGGQDAESPWTFAAPPAVAPRRRRLAPALMAACGVATVVGACWAGYSVVTRPASVRPPAGESSAPIAVADVPSPTKPARRWPDGYTPEDPAKVDAETGLPEVLVRTANGHRIRFPLIRGGTFTMGDGGFVREKSRDGEDRPAHPATVPAFYIQQLEVTNQEVRDFLAERKLEEGPPLWQRAWNLAIEGDQPARHLPAVGLPHDFAEQFAAARGGRLPTEAQWEYAARSRGGDNPYPWREKDRKPSRSTANLDSYGNAESEVLTRVGAKKADDRTEQGVFDMLGNVREWCRDRWMPYDAATPGDAADDIFVVRGGSFRTDTNVTTTRPRRADKNAGETSRELNEYQAARDIGFRIVIEPEAPR